MTFSLIRTFGWSASASVLLVHLVTGSSLLGLLDQAVFTVPVAGGFLLQACAYQVAHVGAAFTAHHVAALAAHEAFIIPFSLLLITVHLFILIHWWVYFFYFSVWLWLVCPTSFDGAFSISLKSSLASVISHLLLLNPTFRTYRSIIIVLITWLKVLLEVRSLLLSDITCFVESAIELVSAVVASTTWSTLLTSLFLLLLFKLVFC